ncbi:MAG: hypothetical protein IPM50_00825 [Acidobacteriota bacterium]|nr:MAG: hypothetical protein IPM50_00825 [Acidobacteriota bacterium]
MSQVLEPGDFLVYQLEAGFGLLRLLAADGEGDETVWHVCAYEDFYPDVDMAVSVITEREPRKSIEHITLTNRAFESTQVAKLLNLPISAREKDLVEVWRSSGPREVSDRSIRLLLGFR